MKAIHFRMTSAASADFDWGLVRSFLAVLDAGSVSAAAQRSGARQPTLSRHVAELELQLGAPLFERTGRGVAPRRMEEAALALAHGLATARSATRGVVRVTTSQVAATWLLPAVLARLQHAHPEIEIELVASNELTNLLRREADIAVRMVRPVQQSLIAKKLGEIEIVAAAHKSYLAKAPPLRTPDDLAAHRLIGYDRDDLIIRGAARMGLVLSRGDFALRTDDQVVYGRLVAEGARRAAVLARGAPRDSLESAGADGLRLSRPRGRAGDPRLMLLRPPPGPSGSAARSAARSRRRAPRAAPARRRTSGRRAAGRSAIRLSSGRTGSCRRAAARG
jgi:DNA-binding transcriptional LysR family regulator